MSDVAIVTMHVPGRDTLRRCCESVAVQRCAPPVRHLVCVDATNGASGLDAVARACRASSARLVVLRDPGGPGGRLGRIARLRAQALTLVDSAWLAWLDDDNWWSPDHLATLLAEAARHPVALVHSWRRLWTPQGEPYVHLSDPWGHDESSEHEAALVAHGIRQPGSSEMRDTLYGAPLHGYLGSIDLGEWLFPTDLARDLGMPRIESGPLGEDDLLLHRIAERGIPVRSTGCATLNYVVPGSRPLAATG